MNIFGNGYDSKENKNYYFYVNDTFLFECSMLSCSVPNTKLNGQSNYSYTKPLFCFNSVQNGSFYKFIDNVWQMLRS